MKIDDKLFDDVYRIIMSYWNDYAGLEFSPKRFQEFKKHAKKELAEAISEWLQRNDKQIKEGQK